MGDVALELIAFLLRRASRNESGCALVNYRNYCSNFGNADDRGLEAV
jgi:hypothetical protein